MSAEHQLLTDVLAVGEELSPDRAKLLVYMRDAHLGQGAATGREQRQMIRDAYVREAIVRDLWKFYRDYRPQLSQTGQQIPFAAMPINVYVRTGHAPWDIRSEGDGPRITDEVFDFLHDVWIDMREGEGKLVCQIVRELWDQAFYGRLPAVCRVDWLMKTPARPSDRRTSPRYIIDVNEMTPHHTALMLLGAAIAPAQQIMERLRETRAQFPDSAVEYFQVAPLKLYFKREAFMVEMFSYTEVAGQLRQNITPTPALENIYIEL